MTDEQKAELAELKGKLDARKDRPGWSANCRAIKARIAEIENDD